MLSSAPRQHDNNAEKCGRIQLVKGRLTPESTRLSEVDVILHGTTMDIRRPRSDLYARMFLLISKPTS